MTRWIVSIIATLVLLVVLAAYGPGSLNAVRFEPTPPDPALAALYDIEPVSPEIRETGLIGAEDIEPGPDGRLYAGLQDGRIMARDPDGGWSEFSNTGGRPLGLGFGPDGTLFVADALRGLLMHTGGDDWEVWLAQAPDGPLVFTDDITVLANGSVILSDASKRYGYGDYMSSYLEGEATGVIYRVDAPNLPEVLADGLAFANGVTHDPSTGLVYFNETWAARVWTLDPDTGERTLFLDGLPGYPDNMHFDPATGLLWIAMPSLRAADIEALHPRPFVKRLIWRWIQIAGLPPLPPRPVMILAVDREGTPVHVIHGPDDQPYGATGMAPWQGRISVGGLERESVDAFAWPETLP